MHTGDWICPTVSAWQWTHWNLSNNFHFPRTLSDPPFGMKLTLKFLAMKWPLDLSFSCSLAQRQCRASCSLMAACWSAGAGELASIYHRFQHKVISIWTDSAGTHIPHHGRNSGFSGLVLIEWKNIFDIIIFPQCKLQERETRHSYFGGLGELLTWWEIMDKQKKKETENILWAQVKHKMAMSPVFSFCAQLYLLFRNNYL